MTIYFIGLIKYEVDLLTDEYRIIKLFNKVILCDKRLLNYWKKLIRLSKAYSTYTTFYQLSLLQFLSSAEVV